MAKATEHSFSKTIFATLGEAYKPYSAKIIAFLTIGLLGRLVLLGNANIIGIWADQFCDPTRDQHCASHSAFFSNLQAPDFILLLALMTFAGFVLTWIFRLGLSRASAMAVSQLYDETTLRTSRFPLSFFDRSPVGRVVTRFSSDYGNVFRLFGGPLAEFISIIFDLIGMIILISVASPFYFPLILLMAYLNFRTYKHNQIKLREARRALSASRSPSIAHFSETAQGASTIRTFNRQKPFSDRFQQLDTNFLNQKIKTVRTILNFSLQMNGLTAVLLLGTGLLATFLYSHGLVSIGSVGVAFGFIALSGSTVQMFFEWMANFEEALVGVERMDQYLRAPMEAGAKLPITAQFRTEHWQDTQAPATAKPNSTGLGLQFENVWFRYAENLPYVFKNINFEVKPGERLGIIGRTGSGKSSLIQALFYFYPLSQGRISIDQLTPSLSAAETGLDLRQYRRQIAFIAQDPTLFNGTLLDNLDISQTANHEHIFQALKQVGLGDWATPEGLKYPIEEQGRNLSLGERQLICLARCLLQDAPIVVMDEATSSVDPLSEEMMVKASNEFFEGRTQLIIAHRLSTLEKCDRILWLHLGEVHRIGPAKEVLREFRKTNLSLSFKGPVVEPTHVTGRINK